MAKKAQTRSEQLTGSATKGTQMFSKVCQKHMKTSGPYTPTGGKGGSQKNKGL